MCEAGRAGDGTKRNAEAMLGNRVLGFSGWAEKRNESLTIVSVRYYWAVEALEELWSENCGASRLRRIESLVRDISTVSVRI
jgi:hypothetical protein